MSEYVALCMPSPKIVVTWFVTGATTGAEREADRIDDYYGNRGQDVCAGWELIRAMRRPGSRRD